MNIEEALCEIDSEERSLATIDVPFVRTLRLQAGRERADGTHAADSLVVDGSRLRLTDRGLHRLCRRARAPFGYISRLPTKLRVQVLQCHIDHADIGESVTLLAQGDELIGLDDPGLLRLRGTEVLKVVLDGLPEGADVEVHDLNVRDERLQVDLLSQESLQEEVAPGDVVRAGLRVTHPMVGGAATVVEAFLLRLICSNGLTKRECVRGASRTRRMPRNHPRARELQVDQIGRLAEQSWKTLEVKLQAFRQLRDERIDVERFLQATLRRAGLAQRLMTYLRDAWAAEGGARTTFAAVNAMSRLATHGTMLSSGQRRVLSGLAGVLAFRHVHLCTRCYSVLKRPADGDLPLVERHA